MSYSSEVLADSPAAYWRLGELSGTSAADASGNARTATYTNTPTLGIPGGSDDGNPAVEVNGTDQYAATASFDFAFADPNVITIEALIRPDIDATGARRCTIYSHNDAASQPMMEIGGSAGTNRVSVAFPGAFLAETADSAIGPGRYWHVVYVRRGAGATHEIWVNGAQKSLGLSAVNAFVNGASIKNIGRRSAGGGAPVGQYFDGGVDEVAVYGTALSAARIAAHYAAFAKTQYLLEVMWDTINWTNERQYLLSAEWTRGRDSASQLTGRAAAGQLNASLQNIGGRFAPFYSAGALYGNLVPARKVRLRTTYPIARIQWQGFLDEIRPDPGSRDVAPTARLSASGPLKWVDRRKASTAVATNVATGTAVGLVLDDAGWPSADRTLDTGQVTMTRWKADGDSAVTHLREIEETEFGFLVESADGKIVFEDVHHRLLSPHTTPQATFSDTAGAALPCDSIEELDPWNEIFNRFEADVVTFNVQSLAVLWAVTGEVPSIGPGASRDFWAKYPTPDAATQADHVDAWTTPVASTDVVANSASDGSGSDLSGTITIAASKFANAMKITLTNTGTVIAYLTTLQARGTGVYRNDPIGVASEDSTSQTKYGKRTFPLPGKFYPTTTRAQAFTDYGISRYKDPVPVLAIGFEANTSDAHMTQALSRDVSERITVVANGTGASGAQLGISRDFYIEAIHNQYDLSVHRVRYELSDASADASYWILGISLLGIDTRLVV